jgi:hypothetical protein
MKIVIVGGDMPKIDNFLRFFGTYARETARYKVLKFWKNTIFYGVYNFTNLHWNLRRSGCGEWCVMEWLTYDSKMEHMKFLCVVDNSVKITVCTPVFRDVWQLFHSQNFYFAPQSHIVRTIFQYTDSLVNLSPDNSITITCTM